MNNYGNGKVDKRCDYGPAPYVLSVGDDAVNNMNFRKTVWTGKHMQMTLMSIPVGSDIGTEIHYDVEQLIRVESGLAVIKFGFSENDMRNCWNMVAGDAVFIPEGTYHNVINVGKSCLKISSIYAPVQHPRGTIHKTKEDAEHSY